MEDLGVIVREFLTESHENLHRVDRDLAALEREPSSRELVSRIFRTIHTLRGTSGFLAFSRLETLARAGESLLSRLRDGVQPVTPATITTLRATIDAARSLVAAIEETGTEGGVDVDRIVTAVHAQLAEDASIEQADADLAVAEPAEAPQPLVEMPLRPAPEPVEGQRRPLGELLVETGATSSSDVASALQQQLDGDDRKIGTILLDEGKAAPAAVSQALQAQAPTRTAADRVIQVEVDLLDGLMNMVGELVLVRNQLARGVLEAADTSLVRIAQRVGMITGELQHGIMKTRMQPIEQVWSTLPALVRDLAARHGKQVRVDMQGRDTRLDRSLLEAVRDPLAQLIRHAVEDSIEDADQRVAAGKPTEGTVTLRAYNEGGHVTVEVDDDGAGLDVDRIAATAVRSGIVRTDQIARMDHGDIMALVLQPGFSSGADASNLDGMDVVKTAVERIGGTVTVDSTFGEGTVWRLTIPPAPAIIQAVTVDCGEQRYVVPQVSVLDLVFIDGQATKIEYASGAPVYRLRGTVLPLVRLDQALGLDVGADQGVYIMVLQADGRRFGLVVDRVLGTEEVVVKAVTSRFKDADRYAGATILGDGKVGLILDVPSLARRSYPAADAERGGGARRDVDENDLVGTAVIQQRVTELLDVRRAILAADPNHYRGATDESLADVVHSYRGVA